MKKLISIFLLLLVGLFFSFKHFMQERARNRTLQQEYNDLTKFYKKFTDYYLWKKKFHAEFQNKIKVSIAEIAALINTIKDKFEINVIENRCCDNNIFLKIESDSDSNIVSFLDFIFSDTLNLAIVLNAINIKKIDHKFHSEINIALACFGDGLHFNGKSFDQQMVKQNIQNFKIQNNNCRLSLFNNKCNVNGFVNGEVSINGIWIPLKYENNNLISTLDRNSTIIVYIKKLNKFFKLELDKEEIISP